MLLRVQPLVNDRAMQTIIVMIAADRKLISSCIGQRLADLSMDGTSTPGLSNSTAPSGYGAVAARTSTYNPCARSFGKPYTKMRNSVASKPDTIHTFPENSRTQSVRPVDHRSTDSALEEVQITRKALHNTLPRL